MSVQPSGITFECMTLETIIEGAWRSGLFWPNVCYGLGECRACVLVVVEGHEHFLPPDEFEQEALRTTGTIRRGGVDARLACQARITGDVTVRKVGVRSVLRY